MPKVYLSLILKVGKDRDMPLLQSILRLFLANHNQPMSVAEIARRLERHDSQAILKVLTAGEIKNGILPIIE